MKPYLFLLIIFIGCSKEQIPERPLEPISMTQTRLVYNEKNQFVKEHLVIHFHRVDEPNIIQQYRNLSAMDPFCSDWNDTLVTKIGKVCNDINHKN